MESFDGSSYLLVGDIVEGKFFPWVDVVEVDSRVIGGFIEEDLLE